VSGVAQHGEIVLKPLLQHFQRRGIQFAQYVYR
jgi:hypothetical protein